MAPRGTCAVLAFILTPALAVPVGAQEADTVEVAAATAPASPAPTAPEPLWSFSASAGIGARDEGPDGTWQALALTRRIGRGYVRGSVMRYHGTLTQADTALPSDYFVGTVSAGGNFDNWVVDGWASYGRQDYGRISTAQGSRPSTGAKGSTYWAVGGDFGRMVPLGANWYFTPTVAGSFADGKLLRPAPGGPEFAGLGLTDLETDEPTWSANATLRLDHAFGPAASHYAGLSVSRNWTSNGVSAVIFGPPGDTATPTALGSKHYADGWFEAGASANMKLARNLNLDLFATRSIGVRAGNVTTAGIALRRAF